MRKSLYAVTWVNSLGVATTVTALADDGEEAIKKTKHVRHADFKCLFEVRNLGGVDCL